MECKFVVGQKVVCVDDIGAKCGEQQILFKGHIYTVSQIDAYIAAILVSVAETPYIVGGWFSTRFKPLEENKTDISVFEKLLIPTTIDKKPVRRKVKENV